MLFSTAKLIFIFIRQLNGGKETCFLSPTHPYCDMAPTIMTNERWDLLPKYCSGTY